MGRTRETMEKLASLLRASGGGDAGGGKVCNGLVTLAGAAGLLYGGTNAMYTVEGGHRAVIYDRFSGVDTAVKAEGLHFLVPWLQRPNVFDIRTRPYELTSLTGSRDLQMVNMRLRVLFAPMSDKLPPILKTIGQNYPEKVLPSIVNEILKSTIAQGEGEAIKLIGDAMRENPGYLQLRRIDAARDISSTISKSQNSVMLDADTLLLNLGSHSS